MPTLDKMIGRGKMSGMSKESAPPEDFANLYHRAFEKFGARALWNVREQEAPSRADALAITRTLRVEGNLAARRLAEQIEKACNGSL